MTALTAKLLTGTRLLSICTGLTGPVRLLGLTNDYRARSTISFTSSNYKY